MFISYPNFCRFEQEMRRLCSHFTQESIEEAKSFLLTQPHSFAQTQVNSLISTQSHLWKVLQGAP